MRDKFNIYEAKTRLSQLVERAERGEEIVIARSGRPVAKLVPFQRPRSARKPGRLKGRIRVAANFDQPIPPEILLDET